MPAQVSPTLSASNYGPPRFRRPISPRPLSSLNPSKAESLRQALLQALTCSAHQIWYVDTTHLSMVCVPLPLITTVSPADITSPLYPFLDHTVLSSQDLVNWHHSFTPLLPFHTLSDHNCLCHSVAITIFGAQDKALTLRRAVAQTMASSGPASKWFKACWKATTVRRDCLTFGTEIDRSDAVWDQEWDEEVKLSQNPQSSLTEIHILVLAHVVRRPIVVYSRPYVFDADGNKLAPCYFGGIYLPHLWDPNECSSALPVLLAYNNGHFSALLPMETPYLIAPLTEPNGSFLPLQFLDPLVYVPGSQPWAQILSYWMEVIGGAPLPSIAGRWTLTRRSSFSVEMLQLVPEPTLDSILNSDQRRREADHDPNARNSIGNTNNLLPALSGSGNQLSYQPKLQHRDRLPALSSAGTRTVPHFSDTSNISSNDAMVPPKVTQTRSLFKPSGALYSMGALPSPDARLNYA